MTGKICCEKSKQTGETQEQSLATLRAQLSPMSIHLQGHDSPLLPGFALATFQTSRFRAQLPAHFLKCSAAAAEQKDKALAGRKKDVECVAGQ